jgi:hypothetical protein
MPSQTYYVSALNQSSTLGDQGAYTGSIEAQPSTTGTTVAGTLSSDVGSLFKFYTTSDGNGNNYPVNDAGNESSQLWTAIEKPTTTGVFANGSLGDGNSSGALWEGLNDLSTAVFGSSEAWDLFSNLDTMKSSYSTAFAACLTALDAVNNTTPVEQLGNAMILNYPERFTLQYNAAAATDNTLDVSTSVYKLCEARNTDGAVALVTVSMDDASTIGSIVVTSKTSGTFAANDEVSITDPNGKTNLQVTLAVVSSANATKLQGGSGTLDTTSGATVVAAEAGVYTQIAVSSSGGSSDALCTCKVATVSGSAAVTSLYVTTTGSGYAKGEALTFTNGGKASSGNIAIASGNSVQAAMLNGSLDSTNGIEFPFESNDVIRVRYQIPLHGSQANPAGDVVSHTSSWFMDFTV